MCMKASQVISELLMLSSSFDCDLRSDCKDENNVQVFGEVEGEGMGEECSDAGRDELGV